MNPQSKPAARPALVETGGAPISTDHAAGLGALVAMLAANLVRMINDNEDVVEGTLLSEFLDEDPSLGSSMLLAYTRTLLGVSDETARLIISRLGAAIEFVLSAQAALAF